MTAKHAIFRRSGLRLAIGFAVFAASASRAAAAVAPDEDFLLGQSARSGTICRAVRDFEDPAAQLRGGKAWAIRCRGWDVTLGHLYAFERDGATAIGETSLWRNELAKRATCGAFQTAAVAGLGEATRADCQSVPGAVAYPVYVSVSGNTSAVAEGLAPLSDVIESGLKVVAGVAAPPALSTQVQAGGVNFTQGLSEAASFVAAANAAEESADFLSNRAIFENHGWMFTDAERDTQALSRSDALSPGNRAVAQLNFALNVSNQGRFAEADTRFMNALETVRSVDDRQIDAVALNYQALHYLNQRRSADASRAAQQAINDRAAILTSLQSGGAGADVAASGREIVISPVLAATLNERQTGIGFGAGLTLAERLQIQDAQSYYVIGVAAIQSGEAANARTALTRAEAAFGAERLATAAVWLHVRVSSALASLDLSDGNAAEARNRLLQAIQMLRTQVYLQATPAEADLYIDLARAEAMDNMIDRALADYGTGFQLLQQSRGSLGDSADSAAGYFDLLLARTAADPANAQRYASAFFDTAQIAMSQATAQTIVRLAARVADTGNSGGVLERALDDLRREITVKTANIRRQQDSGTYGPDLMAADEAELMALGTQEQALQQQLFQSNPRYGQLLANAATLDALQKALSPGELYVKTVLLANRGYAIAVTSQNARIYPFALSRTEAQDAVVKLRRPFDSTRTLPRFDVAASYDLFTKVFGPVENEVRSARHLIYEPDGALISFPASAFIVDAASVTTYKEREGRYLNNREFTLDLYQGLAWLGRNTDISLSVSPTAFLQVRSFAPSRATRPFLGVGNPSTSGVRDPRMFSLLVDRRDPVRASTCEQYRADMVRLLPEVRGMDELIRAVGQRYEARPEELVLGANFTDVGIRGRSDFSNYRVVFFGTHGLLPNSGECLPEPALVTSLGGGDSDAFLDASEILDLKLDAELVVLAACNTGGVGAASADRTGLTGSGEALGGLARDFIYAGGRSLVVSQWSVDQASTVELMNQIFQPGASSQANALRRAQTAVMDMRRFSHPYFWAGFSLVGDGMRPM